MKALGRDLTGAKRYVAPDDDNPNDETVMLIPLPEAIAPGASATIEVAWTAHVPRPFARTGAIGNFFFIAQWFPKLGVFQDEGWNCHQFHAGTEFFSDFGVYDVSLTVPDGWIVGATGVQRSRTANGGGMTTHRYYQEDVHDFAWTTSPDYLERTARFEHATLPGVEMRLLLQPEHAAQAERHFDATRTTLKYYGEWYGAYPYGHVTIVDPAWQSGAGGMEYPTLFTAGTRWLAPSHVTTPEEVTVHEAGHQFWYGIVANNEFEDAWLDEGFNQFSTARAVAQAYEPNYLAVRYFGGFIPWVFQDIALQREIDGNGLPGYRRNAKSDVPATPTYRYFPATGGYHHLQQDGAVAEHHGALAGMAGAAEDAGGALRGVAVQAPEAAGLLQRRQRDRGSRSQLVLRSGLPKLEHIRLWCPGSDEHERRPRLSHHGDCTPVWRSHLPRGRRGHFRERRAHHGTLGRRRSVEGVQLRSTIGRAVGPGRSQSRAAARRELHEQLEDPGAEDGERRRKWTAVWTVWLENCLLSWAALA